MLHALCRIMSKTSHNRFLTDFLEFISLLSEMSKMCTNYNVDSNTKSLNSEFGKIYIPFTSNDVNKKGVKLQNVCLSIIVNVCNVR